MTNQIDEITLFDIDMDGSMEPSEDGQWVRFGDHVKALEAALKECRNTTLNLAKEVCRQVVRETNTTLTWEGCAEIQEALEMEKI
jgi:hypothetical protein